MSISRRHFLGLSGATLMVGGVMAETISHRPRSALVRRVATPAETVRDVGHARQWSQVERAVAELLDRCSGQFLMTEKLGVGPTFNLASNRWDIRGTTATLKSSFWPMVHTWPYTGWVWGFGLYDSGVLAMSQRCFGPDGVAAVLGNTVTLTHVELDFASQFGMA